MPQDQAEILKVKYMSRPFFKMGEKEFGLHVDKLMLVVNAITGWRMPENEATNAMLTQQLSLKIREAYNTSNPDEIEYAFRHYSSIVKDYGKNFNIGLFDTVMNAYLSDREEVSRKEEQERNRAKATLPYKPAPDEVMNMRRNVVNQRYLAFLNGVASFALQPTDGIDTLALDGFCEPDLHADFLEEAKAKIRSHLVKERELLLMRNNTAYAREKDEQIQALSITDERVIVLAKKIALVFCFYKFKEAGYQTIYQLTF